MELKICFTLYCCIIYHAVGVEILDVSHTPIFVKPSGTIRITIKYKSISPVLSGIFKDSPRELYSTHRFLHRTTDEAIIFVVPFAHRRDTGVYSIRLKDNASISSTKVFINVFDAPKPPAGPLVIKELENEFCELEWHPTPDDGGLQIQGYIIQRFEGTFWQDVTGIFMILKHRQLRCSKFYYRVLAKNMFSFSKPLDEDMQNGIYKRLVTFENEPIIVVSSVNNKTSIPIKYNGSAAVGYQVHRIPMEMNLPKLNVFRASSHVPGIIYLETELLSMQCNGTYELVLVNNYSSAKVTIILLVDDLKKDEIRTHSTVTQDTKENKKKTTPLYEPTIPIDEPTTLLDKPTTPLDEPTTPLDETPTTLDDEPTTTLDDVPSISLDDIPSISLDDIPSISLDAIFTINDTIRRSLY